MDTQITNVIRLTRDIAAPVEDVFDAWINPEKLKEWFRPGTINDVTVHADARVGGKYRIVMHDGDNGNEYPHEGEYLEIKANEKLVFTWKSHATMGEISTVTVTFEKIETGTRLTLTHEELPDAESIEKHTGGWTGCLSKLEEWAGA